MKKSLCYFLAVFISIPSVVFAIPEWYESRSLTVAEQELVGYGSAQSEHRAKLSATQDIAFQLGVEIASTTTQKTRVTQADSNVRFSQDIQQQTRQKLNALDVIKSEKDGLWYVAVTASAVPYWYSSRLYQAGPDQKMGYGSANDLRTAQLHAAEELALQLGAKVKVDTSKTTRLDNQQINQMFSQDIKIESEHELGEIRLINTQKIKQTWYVVIENGDKRHFAEKLISKLSQSKRACAGSGQSFYLQNLPSIQQLNRALGCKPHIKLLRRSNNWLLSIGGIEQALTKAEFGEFFTATATAGVYLAASKSTVYEEDAYSLQMSSDQAGYLSGFAVYEDGQVALLFDNKAVQPNENVVFPDPASGLELVAELPKRGVKTTDLYLVVLTTNPQSFSEFEEMTDTIQKANSDIDFGRLLRRIESPYAGTLVHTLPLSRKIR
ncbi:MAG: LPP20 family lipoprotein [Gammaproteobacteria bacterium]|nr:LPP20 family lipoprotein [Gammaproteobacteria bacterium]